jgi:hypothetical protein
VQKYGELSIRPNEKNSVEAWSFDFAQDSCWVLNIEGVYYSESMFEIISAALVFAITITYS